MTPELQSVLESYSHETKDKCIALQHDGCSTLSELLTPSTEFEPPASKKAAASSSQLFGFSPRHAHMNALV